MHIRQTFDWLDTKKKLAIFIPNRGRAQYIIDNIGQFATQASMKDYIIVVGNDGDSEIEIWRKYFKKYPDLERVINFLNFYHNLPERNGGFIRNYFIKRCQSEYIFQKDPETVLKYNWPYLDDKMDWIKNLCEDGNTFDFYRPMYTIDVGSDLKPKDFTAATSRFLYRHHWGFAARTKILQELRGYDEKFKGYGYEDTDLIERIYSGIDARQYHEIEIDPFLICYHIPHPVSNKVYQDLSDSEQYYKQKKEFNLPTNPDSWGEGT